MPGSHVCNPVPIYGEAGTAFPGYRPFPVGHLSTPLFGGSELGHSGVVDDYDERDNIYWGGLCDECAGRLLIEVVAEAPSLTYATVCRLHGPTAVMDHRPGN